MRVWALLMAIMSVIVFGFAIAGSADYFLQRNSVEGVETLNSKIGPWAVKTVQTVNGVETNNMRQKITDDDFKSQTCGGFRSHLKAVAAFTILTVIFSFVAIIGFALNITGNDAPIGLAGAAGTIVMGLIAWAIMIAVRNQPHCDDTFNLDDKTKQDPIYKFYNGFYFILIPWIVYVLCFVVAIVLKSGESKSSDEGAGSNEPTSSGKSRDVEAAPAAAEKKDEKKKSDANDNDQPTQEEKAAAAAEKEKRAKASKEADEKRRAEEKAAAEEEERLAKNEAAEMEAELNKADVERRKKIWADLKKNLPTDKKDKEERRRRFKNFEDFDKGNKKYLTAEELSTGCKNELGLGQLSKGLAYILPKAHAMARTTRKNKKAPAKKQKEEIIERNEFRITLVYIKELFDLWFKFDEVNVDNNGFISKDEFEKGNKQLKDWGFPAGTADAFTKANASKAAEGISFADFVDWARKENKAETDGDDTDIDEALDQVDEAEQRRLNHEDVARRRKIWESLKGNLPTNKKSREERARRFQYFYDFDTDKKGYLTLKDVQEGCATVLGLGQLGKGLKHILPLANNSARGLSNKRGQTVSDDEHVEKTEMRMLFVYIHQYFDLWFIFDTLDTGNNGDIDYEEFSHGIQELEKWGDFKIEDPKKEFLLASTEGKDIDFTEFCEWAHSRNGKDE